MSLASAQGSRSQMVDRIAEEVAVGGAEDECESL